MFKSGFDLEPFQQSSKFFHRDVDSRFETPVMLGQLRRLLTAVRPREHPLLPRVATVLLLLKWYRRSLRGVTACVEAGLCCTSRKGLLTRS
jgi:hypothetical protein